jgi:hypothetical protein
MKYLSTHTSVRSFYLISFVLIPSLTIAQATARTYSFKEVGMTLTLPPEFKTIDSAKNADMNKAGQKLMKEATDINVDMSSTKTLITAMKGTYNYISSTVTPFDSRKNGSYRKTNKMVKNALYKTFSDKIPTAKIDSSTTTITIDGLVFDKFRINIILGEKMTMHMFLLSRYYKGYDFGITYLYVDDVTKAQIEAILKSCKFH